MSAYLTLTRRELGAYFVSMTGYVIIAGAALLTGLSFTVLLTKLQDVTTYRRAIAETKRLAPEGSEAVKKIAALEAIVVNGQ